MNSLRNQDPLAPGSHPSKPDHPMVVAGQVIPGDTAHMARCLIEELLFAGFSPKAIRGMSQDRNYQALHAARETLGGAGFEDILDEAATRVGTHRLVIREDEGIPAPCSDRGPFGHGVFESER